MNFKLKTQNLKLTTSVKAVVFLACLIPFGQLVWAALSDNLGVNPIETVTRTTGTWTLLFLLITLSVTPLRRLSGWHWLIKLRRMLGLFAFFYASLHFSTYLVLDQFFDFQEILKDVLKRPYVTVGFMSFVLLTPLALTSTNRMIRRLGKRWRTLHRLVYFVTAGGIVHFLWLVKADIRRPAIYGAVLTLLLGYRVLSYLMLRLTAGDSGKSLLVSSH